ncbi:MAG TPA: hypothetical protein PL039_04085 [Kiritimatiellia bacterium]|nr:hypothetical protein [Lentisphaerota bacterium]HPC19363.1 hypothetical protein [Kiritimatiellia bacterium]
MNKVKECSALRMKASRWKWSAFLFWLGLFCGPLAWAQSMCAEVKIEISQDLTLERQAFDAMMRISNGLDELSLSNVTVTVHFADAEGVAVTATSDPNDTNALFFIRMDSLQGISALSNGVVQPASIAVIHWLIVPAQGAGGTNTLGRYYSIGATLSYAIQDRSGTINVNPDTILVRPMPMLALDYFLPSQVYGDDPWTPEIESPMPFTLGVRVRNSGAGDARNLKIESAQPRIVENELGLLVGFELLGSEIHGQPADSSLLAEFGTVKAGAAKIARWSMTASLVGRFTNFTASFTHANELGGELTSLIESVNTHMLVRDVLVDLPGRDGIRDFLAATDGFTVFESSGTNLSVTDVSVASTLTYQGDMEDMVEYAIQTPAASAALYLKIPLAALAGKDVISAVRRSDGKELHPANVWISKTRDRGTDSWEYCVHLFDTGVGGEYVVTFRDQADGENRSPVLAFIGHKVVAIAEPLNFLVEASDPDGTMPVLGATGLPAGAVFEDGRNGQGEFMWTPSAGQYGVHPVCFTASDGQYEVFRMARLYVGHSGEPLTNGLPLSLSDWEPEIKDVWASSRSDEATVWWDSIGGVHYEIYSTTEPFTEHAAWQRVGAGREGTGAELEQADASLSTNEMGRYYRAVLAGEQPDARSLWGVIRRDVAASGFTMVSPPLLMDRRFNGELGVALAEALSGSNGGIGSGGDEVYIRKPDDTWRMLYLDASGIWREFNGSASEYELPVGHGFWVRRAAGSPARITFAGAVGNDGRSTTPIFQGWNILGLSEGKEIPLSSTFATANPFGAATEQQADQIVIPMPDGSWRRLIYLQGWGEPYDGNWFDLNQFQILSDDEVLEPGAAIYYLRQGEETEITH